MRRAVNNDSRRRLLLVGLVAGLGLANLAWHGRVSAEDRAAVAQAKSLSQAFRGAAKKVMPTVVQIETSVKPRRIEMPGKRTPGENPFKGTPFEEFFEDHDFHGFRDRTVPRRQGLGSGVIIDRRGIILTNNHVVEGADEVTVELSDGRQFKVTDVKTDEKTDLAVLRIKAGENLPAAALGNSDAMEIGDWVIAVGSPFGLEQTVSAGIISGKGRALRTGARTNFL